MHCVLPAVLDSLQSLSVAASQSLLQVMEPGVRMETEADRVVAASAQEIGAVVRPERVIEIFKSTVESKIEALEDEIVKGEEAEFAEYLSNNFPFIAGCKEISAFQIMVKPYTENRNLETSINFIQSLIK